MLDRRKHGSHEELTFTQNTATGASGQLAEMRDKKLLPERGIGFVQDYPASVSGAIDPHGGSTYRQPEVLLPRVAGPRHDNRATSHVVSAGDQAARRGGHVGHGGR